MAKIVQFDPTSKGLQFVSPTVQSSGAASAGDAVGLNTQGKLDPSVLPAEIGSSARPYTVKGALSANDLVNIYYDETDEAWAVRRADATSATTFANGFVKASAADGSTINVYLDGTFEVSSDITATLNSSKLFLSKTAGKPGNYDATAAIYQIVGYLVDEGIAEFEPETPIKQ
jgi:hypothetical protein